MALFGHSSGLVTELPTLAVLMAHFGHYIANFDGVPSELPPGGSSDGTFLTIVELQTLAVLMALFSHAISWSANCQPWQFWWHISATTQSVHRTANLGSFYGTSQSILVSCQQTANLGSSDGTFQPCGFSNEISKICCNFVNFWARKIFLKKIKTGQDFTRI